LKTTCVEVSLAPDKRRDEFHKHMWQMSLIASIVHDCKLLQNQKTNKNIIITYYNFAIVLLVYFTIIVL